MSNFGVGVYFLTVLWIITLFLCWVSVRTGHYIGKISVGISSLLTIVLVSLPKGDSRNIHDANFYDHLFVTRYAILSFLLVSVIVGSVYCFIYVCLAPVETRKVKAFGLLN